MLYERNSQYKRSSERSTIRVERINQTFIDMKKYIKFFLWGLLALIVVMTFTYLIRKNSTPETQYQIEEVNPSDSIVKKLVLTGTIVPRDEVAIKPQIPGIISEILCEPGDEVQVGDIIARLSVRPEIMQISQAEQSISQARINLEQAKQAYDRDKKLYEGQMLSAEEFERSKSAYELRQIELRSAEESLMIIRKGIGRSNAQESPTLIRATVAGKILAIPVKVGSSVIQANNFNEGTTIATIADMRNLLFRGEADETEVGKLLVGQSMSISIGAMGSGRYDASLEYISPQGSSTGGVTLFEVKGRLVNLSDSVIMKLRAGYSANAEIIIMREGGVMTIPESCVSYRADSAFVQLVTSEHPLETTEQFVRLGTSDGTKIIVKEGLKAGDKLRGNPIINL